LVGRGHDFAVRENVKEPCHNPAGGDELENRVEKLRKERGLNQ
jgi:hypothetical protein